MTDCKNILSWCRKQNGRQQQNWGCILWRDSNSLNYEYRQDDNRRKQLSKLSEVIIDGIFNANTPSHTSLSHNTVDVLVSRITTAWVTDMSVFIYAYKSGMICWDRPTRLKNNYVFVWWYYDWEITNMPLTTLTPSSLKPHCNSNLEKRLK
jgi:hypothetical protein